jgi:hypothetical protein
VTIPFLVEGRPSFDGYRYLITRMRSQVVVVVVLVTVGSRPHRVEPSAQLAEHCAEILRDQEEPAQTRLHKPPRQVEVNPGGIHRDPKPWGTQGHSKADSQGKESRISFR